MGGGNTNRLRPTSASRHPVHDWWARDLGEVIKGEFPGCDFHRLHLTAERRRQASTLFRPASARPPLAGTCFAAVIRAGLASGRDDPRPAVMCRGGRLSALL